MSNLPIHSNWTVEEYLAMEEEAEIRHEFINGHVYAMAGTSRNHILITHMISSRLLVQTQDRACEVFPTEMRVQVSSHQYFYPDISVVCGKEEYANERQTTLLNPTVIIEVLSPSTETIDRRPKLYHYRTIPTLQEYWMFAQDQIFAERFLRKEGDVWEYRTWNDLTDTVEFPSIGCMVVLRDVYSRVNFDETETN